jgi:RHS repeat-associated protein
LPSTLTHHHTVKQSRKTFSGRYSAYRSNRTPLKKSIPIKSPPNPLFAKRGKKNEYDEAKTRVIKHNESTGKITQYINDLFDIEDGEEKIYFFSGDLKLATLDSSSSAPTGDPDECDVPTSGNWTVNSDCTIATFETAPADVTITAGTILTIASSGILEVDLNTNSLTVENGGGILIENGGSLAQVGVLSPLPGGTQGGVELVFHHSDHLSGASVDTDESGSVVALNDYYPFGDTRIESGEYENDYTYTGKERDEDTELLYYEARYYDSGIGRFISIDPWSGDITDPQSLNKYAYVRNNPLKYVDPEGEAYVSSFFQGQLTNFLNVLSLGFNNQKQQAQIASNRAKWQTLSAGGRVAGFSVTSTLLEHSLQDDPSDLIFTNGSDIANKVQQSSEYNDFVDQSISIATQEGKTSFTDTVTEESITFNSGDLFLAVHGTHSTTISGNLNDDGTWSVQTNIHDVYDFKQAQTYAENQSIESSAAWTLNNEAYKDQESGAINNYNININITEKRKRKQTNSGSNSNK